MKIIKKNKQEFLVFKKRTTKNFKTQQRARRQRFIL